MATIIRRSPYLLGGKYFCTGASNRLVVSARDSRKLLYLNSSKFGDILSTTSVAANPGAVCFLTSTVHCICEDGYLRKFTLSTDTLSAVVSTVNAYTQVSTWIFTHGSNFVCPWGWDGVQIMTHSGTTVVTQRGSGLSNIKNAYLNGNRLYCFDGIGKGVVLTVSTSNVIVGEQFTIPSGTNVDCIGLVNATTLGIGANTNPQYITLSLADPDAPVWASRTLESAAIGAVGADGPLISTDISPLSSDAGVYAVNGGTQVAAASLGMDSFHGLAASSSLLFDGNGIDQSYVCPGSTLGGQLLAHWPMESNALAVSGADPTALTGLGGCFFGSIGGKTACRVIGAYSAGASYNRGSALITKGFTVTYWMYSSDSNTFTYIFGPDADTRFDRINPTTWAIMADGLTTLGTITAASGWRHVALSVDWSGGGTAKGYINGVLVAQSAVLGAGCRTMPATAGLNSLVGTNGGGSPECAGRQLRLYSKALTAADINAIMAADT